MAMIATFFKIRVFLAALKSFTLKVVPDSLFETIPSIFNWRFTRLLQTFP